MSAPSETPSVIRMSARLVARRTLISRVGKAAFGTALSLVAGGAGKVYANHDACCGAFAECTWQTCDQYGHCQDSGSIFCS